MDFSRVKQFVSDAKAAGLTIYGHTLAWHSQQQPGYLLGLMKDKELDVPDEEKVDIADIDINYKGMKSWSLWHSDFKNADENTDYSITTGSDGVLIKNNVKSKQNYMVQYQMAGGLSLKSDVKYTMTIKMKASGQASVAYSVGDWYPNNYNGNFVIDTVMKEYSVQFEPVVEGGFVLFQTGDFVGDILVESLKITHKGSDQTIPLTEEEKRDTLVWAMDRWIAGMMEATDGYVKAWDVVNEALSGSGNDGSGNYVLQNYANNNISDPSNVSSGVFYWQAFMGDLEYVRTAVASARKHFKGNADELKLFVNDYNLESDWDDNKKVKSLVGWIKKWEADGVTKIDGIGTQMHISCFEDANIQKNIENHIVNMFKIMAASGKLCRISELDMGYVRGNQRWGGTNLKTSQLTEEEHQKMADFYEFIIKKYFEIIPPAQQYGICQWCLTDAPNNSGWRGGEPVGIWTENFKARKAAYGGFVKGLAEK
ncbi:MAG: endo-1,4-beta-xylanase [Salinivirgaceae bacterium]|nr:endo-1,4-beta-xylanase [Salinivirgaceae bacterium]